MSWQVIVVGNVGLTVKAEIGVTHSAEHGVTGWAIWVGLGDSSPARWAHTRDSAYGVQSAMRLTHKSVDKEREVVVKCGEQVHKMDVCRARGDLCGTTTFAFKQVPNTSTHKLINLHSRNVLGSVECL